MTSKRRKMNDITRSNHHNPSLINNNNNYNMRTSGRRLTTGSNSGLISPVVSPSTSSNISSSHLIDESIDNGSSSLDTRVFSTVSPSTMGSSSVSHKPTAKNVLDLFKLSKNIQDDEQDIEDSDSAHVRFNDIYKTDHSIKLLSSLNNMRNDESLCDYEIRVNGKSFFCHKFLLIAMSDFF